MFASRRALAVAPRLPRAGGRSIAASLVRFSSTEAAAAAAAPAPEAEPPKTTTTTTTTTRSTGTSIRTAVAPKPRPIPVKPRAAIPAKAPASTTAAAAAPSITGIPAPLVWNPTAPPPQGPNTGKPDAEINWEKSYYGLGTSPVTPEQFKILTEAINLDDVVVKPDGIIYMAEIKYRRKLNEAFGPMGWGIVPRGEAVVGTSIVTREYALIVNGCFVSQAQGVNNYFGAETIPTAVEGCKSNALMRCCKDLGISSELWEPRFIKWYTKNFITSQWVENANTKKKRRWFYKKGDELDLPYPYKASSM